MVGSSAINSWQGLLVTPSWVLNHSKSGTSTTNQDEVEWLYLRPGDLPHLAHDRRPSQLLGYSFVYSYNMTKRMYIPKYRRKSTWPIDGGDIAMILWQYFGAVGSWIPGWWGHGMYVRNQSWRAWWTEYHGCRIYFWRRKFEQLSAWRLNTNRWILGCLKRTQRYLVVLLKFQSLFSNLPLILLYSHCSFRFPTAKWYNTIQNDPLISLQIRQSPARNSKVPTHCIRSTNRHCLSSEPTHLHPMV